MTDDQLTPDFDVVVLGSGATGLTAAFTAAREGARVALFERGPRLGGTSAWSGGYVWVPQHPHQADIGVTDSREEALAYVMSVGGDSIDPVLAEAFVDNAPQMVSYLEEHGDVEFVALPGLPDYRPELPGGKPGGGRSLGTPLFAYPQLGDWADRVEITPYYAPDLAVDETGIGATVPRPPDDAERQRRQAAGERGQGASLIGYLLRAALAAGVHIETDARAVRLITGGGRVVGVELEGAERPRSVRAGAVILATGGFEADPELRATFLRGPVYRAASIPSNTGDGLRMVMRIGAALQNMREAWWIPVADLPPGVNAMNLDMINGDRARPRSIMVNRRGERFANEAADYHAFGTALMQEDVSRGGALNSPAWVIHDHGYLTRYGSRGQAFTGEVPVWLESAATLAELAETIGVDPTTLEATVERWNGFVDDDDDRDFGRGNSAHDRWWGDPWRKGERAATLGRIDTGPFYALKLHPGVIGTKGGPRVDVHGRVSNVDGDVIEGLYAAGNVSSPTGAGYGGAGGTLGPNMTFAWLAARHAVSVGSAT